jgi:cysteine desulfurase/selenocysteine lyase
VIEKHSAQTTMTEQKSLSHLRRYFPLTKGCVYLNNASEGPLPLPAKKAMEKFLHDSVYTENDHDAESFRTIEEVRRKCAKLIGAKSSEIALSTNTSYGLNLVCRGLDLKRGDEILLPEVEFPANMYPWLNLKSEGIRVKFIRCPNGFLDTNRFHDAITPKTRVFSVSFVQFFNGYKNDLKTLGEICRKKDIFFVVDGIQGVGNQVLDVKKCGIDLLSCGGHKWLLSPPGTGFVYLSSEAKRSLRTPFSGWLSVDWCRGKKKPDFSNLLRYDLKTFESARRFEFGSYPVVDIRGFNACLDILLGAGIRNIEGHNRALLQPLIDFVRSSSRYRLQSSLEKKHLSSIINVTGRGIKGVYSRLTEEGIVTSFREGGVRISPHLYNSGTEIQKVIDVLDADRR